MKGCDRDTRSREDGGCGGSGGLLRAYRVPLGLQQDAWDIYLHYGPGARWDEANPPRPGFWMHQLDHSGAPVLDPEVLAERARQLLAAPH